MKGYKALTIFGISSTIALTTYNILAGEALNVFLLGMVPLGESLGLAVILRYADKKLSVIEETAN